MIRKYANLFLIFLAIAAPFALITAIQVMRFWGRSFLIQTLIFSGLTIILSIILTIIFLIAARLFKIEIKPSRLLTVSPPFLIGLIFIVQLPIWQPPLPIHKIQISILKGHNSKSSDSEVDLLEFKYGERVIPFDKLEQIGLWNIKSGSLASNDQLGKELVYYGDPQFDFATTAISFLFHTSDKSGSIEIQVDGERLSLDLYSQVSGQTRTSFTMEKTSYEEYLMQTNRRTTIIIGSILLFVFLISIFFLLVFEKNGYPSIFMKKKELPKKNQVENNEKIHDTVHKWQNRKILKSLGFILVSISATLFGLWFKITQLRIIDAQLEQIYPIQYFIFTVFISILIFFIFWGAFFIFEFRILGIKKTNLLIFTSAVPFVAFSFGFINFSLFTQFLLFFILKAIILIGLMNIYKTNLKKFVEPVLVLIALLIFMLFAFQSLSPLFHTNPFLDMWGRMDLVPVYESQWENAKAFDFTGMFTQKTRLGGNANGIGGNAEFLAVLSLIFDKAVVDLIGKYTLLQDFMFFMYIFGTFGMYVFLRYGLKIKLLPSLIGALGFIYGNAAFLSYLGGEFFQHQGEFLFLPWVFLILKIGHEKSSIPLIALAGLVAALPEFVWNVHPEMRIISYSILNLYNLFLIIQSLINNHSGRSFRFSLVTLLIFPLFIFLGIAFRIFNLFDLIVSNEYSVTARYRVGNAPTHLIMWGADPDQIYTLLFRYKYPVFIDRTQFSTAGSPILYYLGQILIFPIFFLFFDAFRNLLIYFKKLKSPNTGLRDSDFFLILFILIFLILIFGSSFSPLQFFDFLPFNLHYPARLLVYFFLFGLLAGVSAINLLLEKIHSDIFIGIIFLFFILLNLIANSKVPFSPDNIQLELALMLCVFFGILMARRSDSKMQFYSSSIYLLLLAVISFSYSNADSQKYLSRRVEANKENIYVSLRSAFAFLQNNTHDYQSNLFIQDQVDSYLSKENIAQSNLSFSQPSLKEKIESIDLSAINAENKYVYTDFLGSANAAMVPLGVDTYNAVNYYLPDSYNTFISGFPQDMNIRNSYLFGLGKNFDLNSISHYGGVGLYPSISSFPYLFLLSGEKDQPTLFTFDIPNYLREPFLQKLSNIAGIDYIVYLQSLFPDAYSDFLNHGFIPVNVDNQLGMVIFQNPNSYGKAYLANRVESIDPEMYYANNMPADEKMNWPYSAELISSFKGFISKIPDDKYSTLIETDQKNIGSNPETVEENNSLTIKKILASKAMFDVNCQSAPCWLVYNSSFLKGWKAFVGSDPVKIYRANLGFIGIQVPAGNHTVWLEYRPDSRLLGECITLIAWFFITSLLVLKLWNRKSG